MHLVLENQTHKIRANHADLWLACYIQEEIAARVGCSQPEVSKFIPNGDIAILNKNQQAAADHADLDLPIYNVWKQQEKAAPAPTGRTPPK